MKNFIYLFAVVVLANGLTSQLPSAWASREEGDFIATSEQAKEDFVGDSEEAPVKIASLDENIQLPNLLKTVSLPKLRNGRLQWLLNNRAAGESKLICGRRVDENRLYYGAIEVSNGGLYATGGTMGPAELLSTSNLAICVFNGNSTAWVFDVTVKGKVTTYAFVKAL
ncbi:MAG: hypothetical protein ACXWQO_13810 [Bdellovibrionota bacterium]